VRELVEEHLLRTDSGVARRVLHRWPRFVKVMPHDYKAALRPVSAGGHGVFTTESEAAA
jgi:glutamate synthase domain-containing protein 3